jgi:hypothetical protein
MKLLLENWREYMQENEMIVYRGIPDSVYKQYIEDNELPPLATDIIPRDHAVMEYALDHGFDEEQLPQWAKEATMGINATTDRENAEGYGNVIKMAIIGDDYVELPGGYVFIKDYDQVRVIDETPT